MQSMDSRAGSLSGQTKQRNAEISRWFKRAKGISNAIDDVDGWCAVSFWVHSSLRHYLIEYHKCTLGCTATYVSQARFIFILTSNVGYSWTTPWPIWILTNVVREKKNSSIASMGSERVKIEHAFGWFKFKMAVSSESTNRDWSEETHCKVTRLDYGLRDFT
jgi:hypothetical protein